GWPVFDRCGLALLQAGEPAEPLARQECAVAIEPPKKSRRKEAVPQATPRAAGTIALPDGKRRAAFSEWVEAAPGGLSVRYKLADPVPEVAPAVVLYMEQAERAARIEATAPEAREAKPLSIPFDGAALGELTLGSGTETISIRARGPLAASARPLGR